MEFIKLTDEVIRNMLRDYRIKYGKDPNIITVNKKTADKIDGIYSTIPSHWDHKTTLFGIPLYERLQNESMLLYNKVI